MVRSKAASGDGMEQGMLNDSSTHNQSVSDPPPFLRVAVDPQKDPSPISMPSTSSIDRTAQVSATRVEYDATDTGVLFSVPVTSEIPQAVNNSGTYHDGYDSDGEFCSIL